MRFDTPVRCAPLVGVSGGTRPVHVVEGWQPSEPESSVPRDQAPAQLPDYDYWLFDSSRLIVMRFDDADRFVGGELVEDPSEVVRANYWRDAAWHRAVRRDDFATEQN